jgi:2,5-dioxopentanoate dehydrogenase
MPSQTENNVRSAATVSNRSLLGQSLIGFRDGKSSAGPLYAVNPTTGQQIEPAFYSANVEEIQQAVARAVEAFDVYRRTSGRVRGGFLRKIAEKIESIAADIVERAGLETALPAGRLQGEVARTCGQLRLFAQVAEEGSWVDARIDRAEPDRKPQPRPDIRSMLRPLGPVVVFGASNFPLAFSVAGGDTASALASGNPVIVKAHPAHPGTSEFVGRMIRESVGECGLPEGTFSLLFDAGIQVGTLLVKHPSVKAGGFTGSHAAGKALMDLAASRPEPIPFYAEMGSTNPVFILPGALHERGETIAAGLHASFTLGGGQFCTKPGLIVIPQNDRTDRFKEKLKELVAGSPQFHLLTKSIHSAYGSSLAERKRESAVALTAEPPAREAANGFCADPAIFETDATVFLKSDFAGEIFGPTTLLVQHSNREQVLQIARALEGHLTATIHGTDQDLRDFSDLVSILETKVGRLVFNSFPTGVEVSHAMVHGGPYPATSDGRSTSVGTRAIQRFARLVCYQGFPDEALPEELKEGNPLSIWRMVDGQMVGR